MILFLGGFIYGNSKVRKKWRLPFPDKNKTKVFFLF